MSNYGGGHKPKARVMMTEEEEYMEGLYANNDSGRDPRASGSNTGYIGGRDPKGNGGYAKGNTPSYKIIKFACPARCDHKTILGSLATMKNFREMAVGAMRVLVKRKGICS